MKKQRFSEEQIIKVLQEGELGLPVSELIRKYGIAPSTYYKWKTHYAGLSISELKRLKQLEDENRQLKQMYANLSLDNQVLKDIVQKKLKVELPGGI